MILLLLLMFQPWQHAFVSGRASHTKTFSMWEEVIHAQMQPFDGGISREMLDAAIETVSALSGGWHILVMNGTLYAKPLGAFAKAESANQQAGVPHGYLSLLLKFLCQDQLDNVEFVLQPGDAGVVPRGRSVPVFSFARNW